MLRVGRVSLATIFTLIAACCNLIILLGTLRRMPYPEDARTYSYLSNDYPIEMPLRKIPTVEMTLGESSRFILSSNDSYPNWETLYKKQFGIGFYHLGPYQFRFISGAYHSLHCVYNMRLALDKPHHLEHPDHHFVHCLMYMQQIFLCNADMALEDGDFMSRNFTMDRVGQTRRCRDWSITEDWLDGNFREWAKYNGLDLNA